MDAGEQKRLGRTGFLKRAETAETGFVALSRRKQGFESPRERHVKNFPAHFKSLHRETREADMCDATRDVC